MKIHKYENHIYSEIYSEMRVTPFVTQIPIYLVPWTEDKTEEMYSEMPVGPFVTFQYLLI